MQLMPALKKKLETESDLGNLPALTGVLADLQRYTSDPSATISQIGEQVVKDPSLSVRLLHLANSAYYNLSEEVISIEEAILFLGIEQIRTVSLSMKCVEKMSPQDKSGFEWIDFWRHCIATAYFSRMIGRFFHRPNSDPELDYMAGLLHDVGKLVIATLFPEGFGYVITKAREEHLSFSDAERAYFDTDHGALGGWYLERQKVPPIVSEAVRCHHNWTNSVDHQDIAAIVSVADAFSHECGIGSSGSMHEVKGTFNETEAWYFLTQRLRLRGDVVILEKRLRDESERLGSLVDIILPKKKVEPARKSSTTSAPQTTPAPSKVLKIKAPVETSKEAPASEPPPAPAPADVKKEKETTPLPVSEPAIATTPKPVEAAKTSPVKPAPTLSASKLISPASKPEQVIAPKPAQPSKTSQLPLPVIKTLKEKHQPVAVKKNSAIMEKPAPVAENMREEAPKARQVAPPVVTNEASTNPSTQTPPPTIPSEVEEKDVKLKSTISPLKIFIPKPEVKPLFKTPAIIDAEIIALNSAGPEIKPPIISHVQEIRPPERIVQPVIEESIAPETEPVIETPHEETVHAEITEPAAPVEVPVPVHALVTPVQTTLPLDPLLSPDSSSLVQSIQPAPVPSRAPVISPATTQAAAVPATKPATPTNLEFEHPLLRSAI